MSAQLEALGLHASPRPPVRCSCGTVLRWLEIRIEQGGDASGNPEAVRFEWIGSHKCSGGTMRMQWEP